jgi:Domain of unknown function (DUF4375)
MPCKGGYRDRIEEGKRRREEEKRFDKSPARLFWLALVRRVHAPGADFRSLSKHEQTYYSVRTLVGEVFNGGFYQFFSNHSGELYAVALDGLLELEANTTYGTTVRAKELLFGGHAVPIDFTARNELLPDIELLDVKDDRGLLLDSLETDFYADPDQLDTKLSQFANTHGLYASDA